MFTGLGFGMVVGALALGLRHGVDWDHLAALGDLTGGTAPRRRRMVLASAYAIGHAAVVLVLGGLAVALGASLPASIDGAMERIVGLTLVALGAWVTVGLIRHGRDFRLRSRWMLLHAGAGRLATRLRHHVRPGLDAHGPERGVDHGHPALSPTPGLPVAAGIGALHGIGAETPTQLVLLTTAAGAEGRAAGLAFLVAFVTGLVVSNTGVAAALTWGRLDPERSFGAYAALSMAIAAFSIGTGTLFLLGAGDVLPSLG